ncbi:hypothetical protein KC19_3G208400 [Ceratodon purpureus]|uniref:Uncharacterized protein n=1 Tax=Ceratodon purpureus TaxID=3225 RepID=A0A8T0IKV9_CERPU|nr:hypothetical protein KC19_3G208400 [Ceratodon purpureus]
MFLMLYMAGSVVESAATGRAMLSVSSNDSMGATARNQETVLQWVQITVVPLGVFLLGACIWGIIQHTAASLGNSFTGFGEGQPETDNQVSTENHLISNVRVAQDLEEGLQVPNRRMDVDGRTETLNSPVDAREYEMQSEFNVPNDGEITSAG